MPRLATPKMDSDRGAGRNWLLVSRPATPEIESDQWTLILILILILDQRIKTVLILILILDQKIKIGPRSRSMSWSWSWWDCILRWGCGFLNEVKCLLLLMPSASWSPGQFVRDIRDLDSKNGCLHTHYPTDGNFLWLLSHLSTYNFYSTSTDPYFKEVELRW